MVAALVRSGNHCLESGPLVIILCISFFGFTSNEQFKCIFIVYVFPDEADIKKHANDIVAITPVY